MWCTHYPDLLDPAVRSPRSWFLDKVKGAAAVPGRYNDRVLDGIKTIDRYTVQITLSEPFAPFISILGMPHTSISSPGGSRAVGRETLAASRWALAPFALCEWDAGAGDRCRGQ